MSRHSSPFPPTGLSRRQVMAAGLAALGASAGLPAWAQANRQVRYILGFSAGGGADGVARLIASAMAEQTGSRVLVENKPGAGGRIAANQVRNEPADGSSVFFGSPSVLTLLPHVVAQMPFDSFRDFTPVVSACSFPFAIVVSPAIGVNSIPELVTWARANPKRALFGTPGIGLPQHLIGSYLAKVADAPLVHVPFKSGGEATQQLLTGETPIAIATPGQFYGMHQAGKVRMIATTGEQRPANLPEVATLKEHGYEHMVIQDCFGFIGPAGMPASAVNGLADQIGKAVDAPEVLAALTKMGMPRMVIKGQAFADYIRRDYETWKRVVAEVGFKPA